MSVKTWILMTFITLASSACRTETYFGINEDIKPDSKFEKVLVQEANAALSQAFPPGKTTFYFPHKDEKFATDLELKLRKEGYAVITAKATTRDPKGITEIGYKLGSVGGDKDLIVLRVVAGEAWQMSRVYQRQKDGTVRTSGPLLIRKG